MSQWRFNVRRLYDLGGTATTPEIDSGTGHSATFGLWEAKHMGLVSGGRHGSAGKPATWTLTPLGEDWVLGRVEAALNRTAGVKLWFKPTWLSALPQGLRIGCLADETKPKHELESK